MAAVTLTHHRQHPVTTLGLRGEDGRDDRHHDSPQCTVPVVAPLRVGVVLHPGRTQPGETVIVRTSDLSADAPAKPSASTSPDTPPSIASDLPLREATLEFQRVRIRRALALHRDNWAAAARSLGLHRSNLHHLAKRLGLR